MKRASRFCVSPGWKVLFQDMGLDVATILIHARLPADMFNMEEASLSPLEYFQLWHGIEKAAGEKQVPLLLAKHLSVEAFDPPIFASICSPNLNAALKRLSHYKPLIGPLILDITCKDDATTLSLDCYGYDGALPESLILTEMVFFTQLARLATRENVSPLSVSLTNIPEQHNSYEEWFDCPLKLAAKPSIAFSAQDANKPFITKNAAMWAFFEDKLNQKLGDLDTKVSTADRVRAILMESLPAGECHIEFVAQKLTMSKRTLQRKLNDEAETYQSVLQSIRLELADHYLEKSRMSLGEISFLLGFNETNSFSRAYSNWKGVAPGIYREQSDRLDVI